MRKRTSRCTAWRSLPSATRSSTSTLRACRYCVRHQRMGWAIFARLGSPDKVNLDYHEALTGPAVSRYAATTPKLLRWFATYNKTRSYEEQVKPFGFLLAFLGKEDFVTEVVLDGTEPSRRWTKPKPIAPYHKNLEQALAKVRDRNDEIRTIQ